MFDKDLFGDELPADPHGSILATHWEYPPFSVLNAREGWWQERKRAWLALGIKSELGRGGGATWGLNPDMTSTRKPSMSNTASTLGNGIDADG